MYHVYHISWKATVSTYMFKYEADMSNTRVSLISSSL